MTFYHKLVTPLISRAHELFNDYILYVYADVIYMISFICLHFYMITFLFIISLMFHTKNGLFH